ncbi:metalloprotease [Panaeolus papilionaceus]|nr:metalloprotease [Panaeolus papilionaceus]
MHSVHCVLNVFDRDLGCGSGPISLDTAKTLSDIIQGNLNNSSPSSASPTQIIPVYFHVITEGSTILSGDVLPWQINEQIKVLNDTFKDAGVQFALMNVDRTVNAEWYHKAYPGNSFNEDMMRTLRKGGVGDLNLYIIRLDQPPDDPGLLGLLMPQLAGYATFPWEYSENPVTDGVVLTVHSLPGSILVGHNEGKIGTHEVGHWLGLLHPFEVPEGSSGCEDTGGDDVDDTPAENGPARFCPIGRDSCPGGGPDPIHNYMDYTDDYCRFEFTPGQIRRLKALTRHYRGYKF